MADIEKQRYFLLISFKGTAYHGWQIQHNAHSVQAEMNIQISKILGEEVYCIGCGRTDTGVHAKKFYLHFDSARVLDHSWLRKLNIVLPKDIYAHSIYSVPADAHARWSATERSYTYIITRRKNPFLLEYAAFIHSPLTIGPMNEAAAALKDFDDFEAISKVNVQNKHHLCNIYDARWKLQGDKLVFQVSANRFLRGMVRVLVGTMLQVGKGKMTVNDFRALLASKSRIKAGAAAPADGLYLSDVKYPEGLLKEI